MQLNIQGLENTTFWQEAGYQLPAFDKKTVAAATKASPRWIHFGAGNIFRAFQANLMQQLLDEGKCDTGLIVAEGYDYEIIEKVYHPHDDYSILVTLKSDGSMEKKVIGSITESLLLDSQNEAAFFRLQEIFSAPSLQMASFTITEKGYSLTDGKGETIPAILYDFTNGPRTPQSYLGKVASLLYTRYLHGQLPLSLVSMDNCSHNGDKLKTAILAFAKAWSDRGLVEEAFLSYVSDASRIAYPWSMIDKITPRPDPAVEKLLKADRIDDLEQTVTAKNTWIAPFVNAEESQYLVIEDAFPNGRPPLDQAGVIYTTRETVDKVEKMKVCTCLNPLHTALAIFGCLLGYTLIADEMKNPVLKGLAESIGYEEGLPVVINPGILDPKAFLDEVLQVRIPNPFMPDTPQRIACDTSQKLPVRFGETIKAYLSSDTLSISSLQKIPLVFAGWLRYLMGIDDAGCPFTPSPDPMLDVLMPVVADVRLGQPCDAHGLLAPILKRGDIFGADLFQAGMADAVIGYFTEMIAGPGAVASTLEKYIASPSLHG